MYSFTRSKVASIDLLGVGGDDHVGQDVVIIFCLSLQCTI